MYILLYRVLLILGVLQCALHLEMTVCCIRYAHGLVYVTRQFAKTGDFYFRPQVADIVEISVSLFIISSFYINGNNLHRIHETVIRIMYEVALIDNVSFFFVLFYF